MAEIHQYIDTAFHRCWSDNEKICEERVTEHMLAYIFSGEMIVYDDNKRIVIHAGETVFIRRNHLVNKIKQPANGKPFSGVFLHLEPSMLKSISSTMTLPEGEATTSLAQRLYVRIPENPYLTGYFRSLDQYFTEGQHPSKALMELKLREAVMILLEEKPEIVPVLFDCVKEWKPDLTDFMNRNYVSELSLEEFAHYSGRSLSAFKREFRELFGSETPSRWIVRKRLEKAYELLKANITPLEVYAKVGFKNPSHFSTAFRKQYGIPPSAVIQAMASL